MWKRKLLSITAVKYLFFVDIYYAFLFLELSSYQPAPQKSHSVALHGQKERGSGGEDACYAINVGTNFVF